MSLHFGSRGYVERPSTGAEMHHLLNLTDEEKRMMVLDLLEELGADNIKVVGDEIIHSCILPFGLHANGDRNPSASFNWRKLVFHCYGCGSSGGLTWFIGCTKGISGTEARKWVRDRSEVDGEEALKSLIKYLDSLYDPERPETAPPIPTFNPQILAAYEGIHPYLTDFRKIPVDNCRHFQVGYDQSTNRIVLPHFWRGDLVGWQTRRLTDDGTPKYKNTPDFPKNETLFNFNGLRANTPHTAQILVVESVMSVISKWHLAPMTSTFGASVTEKQKRLLANCPVAVLWFDNDEAGWNATRDVGDYLVQYGSVFVVESEWAADPADLSDEDFEATWANKVPYPLWHPPEQLKEYHR